MRAFVPPPLQPAPAIDVLSLLERLGLTARAHGRLDGVTVSLPRQELFLHAYVRKKAVLFSQIDGLHKSTFSGLLRFETEAQAGQPVDDICEVSNYVGAMMDGLERLETLPMSLRLIREMHATLLQSGRGGKKDPGEFRRSQNWIDGTRLVKHFACATRHGNGRLHRCVSFEINPIALSGMSVAELHSSDGAFGLQILRVYRDQAGRILDCDLEYWLHDAVSIKIDTRDTAHIVRMSCPPHKALLT